jgi:TRAP-type C4-dicarboxylate transport system substrate-binding protein
MKRFIFISLTVLLVVGLVLTGCSTPTTTPSPSASSSATATAKPTATGTTTAPASPTATAKPTTTSPAGGTINLVFSTWTPGPSADTGIARAIMDKITQATSGKVTFQFYSDAALGGPVVHYDLAVNGVADIVFYNFASQLGRFPLIDALQMPFMTPNADAGSYAFFKLYSDFPELRDQLKQVKVINLGMNDPTFPDTTTRAGQVKTLADLRGKKIRVSGPEGQTLTALGGTPVSIVDMGEVYLSLSNGILDGLIIGNQALVSFKFGEVVHYYTQWDGPAIRCLPFGFFMNMDKWNSLPKDIQDAIDSSVGMKSTWGYQNNGATHTKAAAAGKKFAEDKGGVFYNLPADELAKWVDKCVPVQQRTIADLNSKGLPGDKYVAAFQKYIKDFQSGAAK